MDFGGFSLDRLLLIGLIAVILVGPERLPRYAEGLARLVRRANEYLRDTKSRMRDEIGPEIDEVDWRKLDPRQYDPRRIIRDALLDDTPARPAIAEAAVPAVATAAVGAGAAASSHATGAASSADTAPSEAEATDAVDRPKPTAAYFSADAPVPFDPEAT